MAFLRDCKLFHAQVFIKGMGEDSTRRDGHDFDEPVVNNDGLHGPREKCGVRYLEGDAEIKVVYFAQSSRPMLRVTYSHVQVRFEYVF
jgi:hypothetical protein